MSTDDTLPYNIHRIEPYNEAKYNVVFSVTDAVLLEAIDLLLLVMQRTEGAVTAPPPEHQIRGLLIQTIKPPHAFLSTKDTITSHAA